MTILKEIAKHPGYDAAASTASKATIFVFLGTFIYMIFFSGVSSGLLGGFLFFAIGIFAASILISMPIFLLALKAPKLRVVASIGDVLLTVLLTRAAYLWIFAQPVALDSQAFQPRSFQCDQPLPEFTLSRSSDPSAAKLDSLCRCIYEQLSKDQRTIAAAISQNEGSDLAQDDIQQFIPAFGAAVETCDGYEL